MLKSLSEDSAAQMDDNKKYTMKYPLGEVK